jgi:hypothetical protein
MLKLAIQARVVGLALPLLVVGWTSANADSFRNLDLEQANTNRLSFDSTRGASFGSTADLLPGWQIKLTFIPALGGFPSSTNLLETIWFKKPPEISESSATLINSWDEFPQIPAETGNYSLWLNSVSYFGKTSLSLIQRGDVPADATALRMQGVWSGTGIPAPPSATMNGVPLGFAPSGGWDVTPFAGQNVEFTFSLGPNTFMRLDGFEFMPVAEPNSLKLWALAFAALVIILRKRPQAALKAVPQEL